MENILKTIIGPNFKGTFATYNREKIDVHAFLNLNSLYLKEMEAFIWVDFLEFDSLTAHMAHIWKYDFYVSTSPKKSFVNILILIRISIFPEARFY